MSKLISNWNYPTAVRFGAGRIAELPEVLAATGIKRPLFVTDPGLAKLPVVARHLKILDDAGSPSRRLLRGEAQPGRSQRQRRRRRVQEGRP